MSTHEEDLPPPLPPPIPKGCATKAAAAVGLSPESATALPEPVLWKWIAGVVGLCGGAVLGPAAVMSTLAVVSLSVGRGGQSEWAVWVVALLPPLWLTVADERDREALGLLSTGSAAAGYYIYREYAERLHNNLSVAGYTELAPWVAIGIWGLIGAVAGIKHSGQLHRVFGKSNRGVT